MAEKLPSELDDEDAPRRLHVELFITHPVLDPAKITDALGLVAQHSHRAGDPIKTPKNTYLPGTYYDTRWRHSIELALKDQRFEAEVEKLVDQLVQHKVFLKELRESGGSAQILVQFFDSYYGDKISCALLSKMTDLGLDLGIECFSAPQH